jgi:hypothetical protein
MFQLTTVIMSINWNNIRSINGSQHDGFEELVCQLASKEKDKVQKKFKRVGKPDGGKECFWELNNGDLHCWQAKYFTNSLSTGQWSQVTKSVKTTIDNHPRIKKYYISIPLDMPDPKVGKNKSMLEKWNQKAKEWGAYAAAKGTEVDFVYWGSFELVKRLSAKENEGLKYFWFNQEEFTDEWFEIKNRESINALRNRYTPKLNFELPIASIFDGLSRDTKFEEQVHSYYKKLLKGHRKLRIDIANDEIKALVKELNSLISQFKIVYEEITFIGNDKIPFDQLRDLLDSLLELGEKSYDTLYNLREEKEREKGHIVDYYRRPFENELHDLLDFTSGVRGFKNFIYSATCRLSNKPYLILTGEAGMGKSHLLADIVEKRKEKGEQSLFLLGENFTSKEMPWTQILNNQLRKGAIDEFVFLGALNAKAESIQARIIIFIDALNEGEGRLIWPKRLKSFIQSFEKYPWVGVVVSVRSSFEDLIAPASEIGKDTVARVKHEGFLEVEYEASKYFFQHYEIVQPSAPLLHPEFQYPLFLKLFCEALYKRGLNEVPSGYEGITTIIDYFLDSIEFKLSQPEELYYDERKRLVRKAVEGVLIKLVDEDKDHLAYEEADEIVDSIFKGNCTNPEPFLKRLISEGVFNTDLFWNDERNHYHTVYFAYQRFQDHLTVSMLLDRYLDKKNPEESFKSGKLNELIKDNKVARFNQNLVEALSVQVPERTNKELYQVAPYSKLFYSVAEGFINSLIWRKSNTINEESIDYVNNIITRDERLFHKFLNVTVSTSMKPGFFFNAERLHIALQKFSLPERDQWWTMWLQDKYGENSSVNSVRRIIDWAWNNDEKSHISNESIKLGCITLSWVLSSSNRYLRDAATKAIVCLLQYRKHLLISLFEMFKEVNDPYIIERLYAAAYGCVLRSNTTDNLVELSEYIYKTIFDKEEVYPHILLRDYAREIIEFTINKNLHPSVDLKKVRPPYRSKALPVKFPTIKEIDRKYKPKGEDGYFGKESWGATAILDSMTTEYGRETGGYGDFGRYVFQSAFKHWNVDYDGLSNYAVQKIFALGYDPKVFSEFDSNQGSGRGSGYKERIGKKYQWIVFYELLAKVSDQYELFDESNWDGDKTIIYDGPWYPNVRDIDPSILVKETKNERYDGYSTNWWFNYAYSNWGKSHKEWVREKKDLPGPASIIEPVDLNGESWIWLELNPDWDEPEKLGEDKWEVPRKRLWYQIRCFLVEKHDQVKFENRYRRGFYRGEMPEARSLHKIFSQEYYWSPAFYFFNKPYYSGEEWIEVHDRETGEFIGKVLRTVEYFNWEEEFDCSKESPIAYYKPAKNLKDGLKMNYSPQEGEFVDKNERLLCFDPSVNNNSISGLMVKKDALLEFLESENLTIMWSVVGEKQIIGGSMKRSEYPGRMNISGLFTLKDGEIVGNLNTQLE